MVLPGLLEHYAEARNHWLPHIVIPLLGCFKNYVGEHYHLLPISAEIKSRTKAREWVGWFLHVH